MLCKLETLRKNRRDIFVNSTPKLDRKCKKKKDNSTVGQILLPSLLKMENMKIINSLKESTSINQITGTLKINEYLFPCTPQMFIFSFIIPFWEIGLVIVLKLILKMIFKF